MDAMVSKRGRLPIGIQSPEQITFLTQNKFFLTSQHRTSHATAARKFGTPLRDNTYKSQRQTQSTQKKKVRVRKTPLSKTAYKSKDATTTIRFGESATLPRLSLFSSEASMEKTVLLAPGPVGFELQPVNEAPLYGCRVTRYVDGGPENPGQARKSGIKPGDLVLKVEAEGVSMTGTTYNEIVDILKLSDKQRTITVQSTLESQGLTSAESENFTENLIKGIALPALSKESFSESRNEVSQESTIESMIQHSAFDITQPSISFQTESIQTMEGTNEQVTEASKSVNASFCSQDTTNTSNKSMSYETMISGGHSAKTEHDDIVSKQDTTVEDTTKQEEQSFDAQNEGDLALFEDSIARADYEQRLQKARREQSKVEQELKDLYLYTCERNESQIRELQDDREIIDSDLGESSVERVAINDARIKELEKQVAEAEKFKMQAQIEAREQIKANANKVNRLIIAKENEWRQKFAELENTITNLREESRSRLVELDMSRTMAAEIESRIRSSETEKDHLANRLEEAVSYIETLEGSISQLKQVDVTKDHVLEKMQERFKKVLQENAVLLHEKQRYESFKEESSVLTEKLAKSVHEKQKELLESQSIADKLNAENDDLMIQIAESTNDVEQLVEEKLLLEEKLALTWKNIEKAKYDASRIHETLLEKQENGEYFTSFDIEEKDLAIQALESQLDSITAASKEELFKSNKETILFHIKLRGAEQKLIEIDALNAKTTRERDDWHKTSIGLEKMLANTKNQVTKMTEIYTSEMESADNLKAQIDSMAKAKKEDDLQIESLSSKLESKENELKICQERLTDTESLKHKAITLSEELKAELEGVMSNKEDSDLEYQKSIESLTLQLESKRSEVSSNEGRLAEVEALKKKHKTVAMNLKAQLAALAHSKDEAESIHQNAVATLEEKIGCVEEEKQNLVTKHEVEVENLTAKLQTEGQKLSASKDIEAQHLQKIVALTIKHNKESEQAQEKIDELTSVLRTQEEDYSCLELRSEKLEEELNSMKLAHNEVMEKIVALEQEKKNAQNNHEITMKVLTEELQSKNTELESTKSDLTKTFDNFTSKSEEATMMHQQEIEELKKSIESLKSEAELSSTQYWEGVQEITAELQEQTEELERCQLELKNLEEETESRKIEIEANNAKIQELEHEIFEKDILAGDLTAKIASQKELLDSNEREISEKEELISSLHSQIQDLNKDVSDKVELQKSCDSLKKNITDLETSKEKMSVEYCSEIFRFVKRLAVLDQTHNDVNEQRKKAMNIAMLQRKLHGQAKAHIEKLEDELKTTSSRAGELENKLKDALTLQKENEHLEMDLIEKSKQLEHQNVMISSLQTEVSALIRLTKHLKESKERELSTLMESNQDLESALSSEKESSAESAGNASDAKMELKMLDKKYNSMLLSKDEALLKSEQNRTTIARNLLQANAVVASLCVQLKEMEGNQSVKSKEEVRSLNQANLNLLVKLEEQDINVKNLKEQVQFSEEAVRELKAAISNLREGGSRNLKVISDLKKTKEDMLKEMKMMTDTINENERQNEQLQEALASLSEGNVDEAKAKSPKKKARLFKNIETLSDKLVYYEETMKQNEMIHRNTEESLKKSISKIRAEYVAKHLETNELKKKIAVLSQDKQMMKKDTTGLRTTISNLQSELQGAIAALSQKEAASIQLNQKLSTIENGRVKYEEEMTSLLKEKDNEMASLNEELAKTNAQVQKMEEQKKASDEINEQEKKEMELSLMAKEAKLTELFETSQLLQDTLSHKEDKIQEQGSKMKSDAEQISILRRELSSKLEILEKEKVAMADTISRQESRLRAGEEQFNKEIAVEINRLREKAGKLEADNFAKTSEVAQLNSTLESSRSRFRDLLAQKNDLESKLEGLNDTCSALQEKVHQDEMRHSHQQIVVMELERERNELRQKGYLANPNAESELSHQLSAVKEAFRIQSAMLEDVKLSESMLETLINEVMNQAIQSESELLELSSVVGTVEDLLLNPSRLLVSLDLSGLGSSGYYFKEVRSRLEDLAAVAYTTGVELNNRQNQLKQWTSNRAELPVLPDTPTGTKQLKRNLFDEKDDSDVTPVITDAAKEASDKLAGARLLCCIMENNNKKKLASAFRKWSCAASALNANSTLSKQQDTASELARELQITREKLMTLKSHMKSSRVGKQKPRLRRILERLDGNGTNQDDDMSASLLNADARNDYSFEL